MIDTYAVVALVGIMIGFITVIGVVIGTMLWLRSDIEAAKTELKSDMSDLKTELKSDMSDLKTELKSDMSELKSELKSDMSELETELKSDMSDLKTELKSDMSELESDINAIDERQRRMENDISFIRGALAVAIPGFKEGMEGLVAEASEEERVSEAVGD